MAQIDACKAEIEDAVGRELTTRELGAIQRGAAKVKAKIDLANGDVKVANDILRSYVDDREAAAIAKKHAAVANALKLETQKANADNNPFFESAPGEAVTGKFVGSQKDFFGGKNSLGVNISHESGQRFIEYQADLKKAGIDLYAASKADSKNMWLARAALEDGKDASVYGPRAAKWAEITKLHQDLLANDLRQEGVPRGQIDSFVMGQNHDSWALARAGGNKYGSDAARDAWVGKVIPNLDWEKSFGGELVNASAAQRTKRLQEVWQQFVAGEHLKWSPSSPLKSREIHFSSPENAFDYHKEFGRDAALGETVSQQLGRGGRDLAIAKEWGPSAKYNIDQFFDHMKKRFVGDNEKLKQLSKAQDQVNRYYWPSLSGELGAPENPAAHFLASARGVLTASKIGASIITMFGDLPLAANNMARYGNGRFWSSLVKSTADQMAPMSAEEKLRVARANGITLNGLGLPMTEGMREYSGVGIAGRISQVSMKYFGHNAWTDKIRTSMMARFGYEHWLERGKTLDQLPESYQRGLRAFGIDAEGWDRIRKQQAMDLRSGMQGFTAQGIREMDHEAFRTSPEDTERQLKDTRTQLADKYRNFMAEMGERATTAPSDEMNALTRLGTSPNTWEGQAVRAFNELKAFVYNYTRNHVGGVMMGYDDNPNNVGWGRALRNFVTPWKGDMRGSAYMGMLNLAAASTAFGAIENTLHDIADGKTPEDPTKTPGDFLMRAMARQSLGIYSDLLFSQAGQPNAGIRDKIADAFGPTVSTSADLVDAISGAMSAGGKYALIKGYDSNRFWHDFLKNTGKMSGIAYRSVPFNNFVATKFATDHYLYSNMMEMQNPGYKKRLAARLLKERGERFWIGGKQ